MKQATTIGVPRPEFPRPDFERGDWLNLNGEWEFAFDDAGEGEAKGWHIGAIQLDKRIIVPFCYQSAASGLGLDEVHETVWYRRCFILPAVFSGKRTLLKFGAVDYECTVWVNGERAADHRGGHVPFEFDATRFLKSGENAVVVRAVDRDDPAQPRGKQSWRGERFGCWYTPTTGIWQTVWLEAVGEAHIESFRLTPDLDRKAVVAEVVFDRIIGGMELAATASFKGTVRARRVAALGERKIADRTLKITLDLDWPDELDDSILWRPEAPNLFDLEFVLSTGGVDLDRVKTYFGMRKIGVRGSSILLNNVPYVQKLVLDQGYWPETLLTPPSDEAIVADIQAAKDFGFNGARKHQKAEDPRFHYWADKLGFLVWDEMPSNYRFTEDGIRAMTDEWQAMIRRDYNHPSIVAWVPLNESWGVWNIISDARMQAFSRSLYSLTKALDGTRLVSSNDGWEQVDSDICAIHDYEDSGENFRKKTQDLDSYLAGKSDRRLIYANGASHLGQPLILTEYGGIAFAGGAPGEWGYRSPARSEAEFVERFAGMTGAALDQGKFVGICYTQLTDVMQEINGLLTPDRKPKIAPEKIRAILETWQ
jgi:beta-galactosidase/beta-glucuronidase